MAAAHVRGAPGQIDFALYPWVISNEKLKSTLGWTPKHTSRETFEITMRAHDKLPPADAPMAPASSNGAATETPSAVGVAAAILGRSPGPLAQLGERRLDKPEVTGSSPVRPIADLLRIAPHTALQHGLRGYSR